MFAAALPTLFGYTGYVSFIVAAILSLTWLRLAIKGFKSPNDKLWARQMFIVSLVAITTLFITLSIDRTRAPKELSLAFFPG
jgi:protoheme IX farnesyltransferase